MISFRSYPQSDQTILNKGPFYLEVVDDIATTLSTVEVVLDGTMIFTSEAGVGEWFGQTKALSSDISDGGFSVILIGPELTSGSHTIDIFFDSTEFSYTFYSTSSIEGDLIQRIYLKGDDLCVDYSSNKSAQLDLRKDYMLIDYLNRRIYLKEHYDDVTIL